MTTPNRSELYELTERALRLSREDQLHLVERILANIRRSHFTDHEANRRALEEMIADPDFQRVLNNQDLPYPGADGRDAG